MTKATDFRRFQAAVTKHLSDVAGLRACHAFIQEGTTAWQEAARIGPVIDDYAPATLAKFDPLGGGAVTPLADGGGWLASYCCSGVDINLCLLFYLGPIAPQELQTQLQSLETKTGWLLVAAIKSQQGRAKDLALSVDLGAQVLLDAAQAHSDAQLADQWIARIERSLSPDLVAVLWVNGDEPRLAAQSGGGLREHPSRAAHALQDIARLTIEQRIAVDYDASASSSGALSAQTYETLQTAAAHLAVARALSLPIYLNDNCRAVVICLWQNAKADLPDASAADLIAQVLSQSLAVQSRAFPNFSRKLGNWIMARARAVFGRKGAKIKLFAAAFVLILVILSLIPTIARPPFEARIEARSRFIVSAPFDGFLADAPYQLGDTIVQGTPVLALDDGDFRLQLARQTAESQRLQGEIQAARSARDTAKVRTLDAQLQQTQIAIDLLDHQLAQTQFVAAIQGLVVGGDAWRRIGGRVRLGEPLLEVADPQSYGLAIFIDESWVAQLQAGTQGALLLAAYPNREIPVRLQQITADASNQGGVNVFASWAEFDAPADLQPLEGMRGIVRLDAGPTTMLGSYTRGLRLWVRSMIWRWQ